MSDRFSAENEIRRFSGFAVIRTQEELRSRHFGQLDNGLISMPLNANRSEKSDFSNFI